MRSLLLLALLLAASISAQDMAVSPPVFRALNSAEQAQARGDLAAARQSLKQMLAEVDDSSLEAALLQQRLGYLAIAAEDYSAAIKALRIALASGQLSAEAVTQDRLNLARLYLLDEQPRAAIDTFLLAGQAATLPLDSQRLLVQAYMQVNEYRAALPLAEAVVAADAAAGDSWYQLLVALNYRLQRYAAAADWQHVLVQRQPGQLAGWRQLAGLQSMAGRQRAAAASLRLAREAGLALNEQDMDNLIALQQQAGAPWQAARLLEEMLAAGLLDAGQRQQQLAQLWQQARDYPRAISAWTRVAERSGRSEHWLQLAGLHLQSADGVALLAALQQAETNASSAQQRQIRQWREYAEQLQQSAEPDQ